MRHSPLLSLVLAVPLAFWIGCGAEAQNPDDGGNDDDDTSGGGDGGSGGAGGAASKCFADCSTVMTPQCQQAVCNEASGQCEIQPSEMGAPCDDGQFCTTADFCEAGLCKGGGTNTCNLPGDPCTTVVCNEASDSCATAPANDGTFCVLPQGSLCVTNTKCQNGICTGTMKDCFFAPGGDCNTLTCNPNTGECDPTPNPGKDGQPCSSIGDLCMSNKTCDNGNCVGGSPKDCSAFTKDCNNGVCNIATGQCEGEPIAPGGSCLDAADECNDGVCDVNGFCQPVPKPNISCVGAANECNDGLCDAAGICQKVPKPNIACPSKANECNDGLCDAAGLCQPVPLPGNVCPSKTDDCNQGICDMGGLCQPTPANEGAVCNDGNSCTLGEFCTAGACGGGMMGQYVAYFSETFASNAAGWTLGTEWAIGPTAMSNCSVANEDPPMDHTPTADNGVAGVVLGGCASTAGLHPFYYLESPVIDTSMAAGQVYLEFWRVLNSDYTPYMDNIIEVFNGSSWQVVWQSGSNNPEDMMWTHVSHDITAHKNAAMKVRFGFNIGSGGVFTEASWNIDDLAIANLVCNP